MFQNDIKMKLKIFFLLLFIFNSNGKKILNYGLCLDADNKSGYCGLIENCLTIKNLLEIQNERQLTLTESNFIINSKCGELTNTKLYCCEKSMFINSDNENANQNSKNKFDLNRSNDKSIIFDPKSLLAQTNECRVSGGDKIYGANETAIDEYPWLGLLIYPDGLAKCGSSLISKRYVVTAAHCVQGESKEVKERLVTTVRFGEWNTATNPDCNVDGSLCAPPYEDIPVDKIIVHENYNVIRGINYNDIALIRLSWSVEYSRFISPICLPITSALRNTDFEGIMLDVSGWGKTETSSRSDIKLKAEVPVFGYKSCEKIYLQNRIIKSNDKFAETQICAGKRGVDSCKGDSGGPLIHVGRDVVPYYVLAGIVSFGTKRCGADIIPGVYTRVGAYVDWILSNIKN